LNSQEFNNKYPVGIKVKYYPIYGHPEFREGKTTTPAWELYSGASVVTTDIMGGGLFFRNLEVFDEKAGKYKKLIIKKPRRELNRQRKPQDYCPNCKKSYGRKINDNYYGTVKCRYCEEYYWGSDIRKLRKEA
jgi:hypothetical protein